MIKRILIAFLKILALLFVGAMIVVQIPELIYDFGPKQPKLISGLEALNQLDIKRTTFASLSGSPDFDQAFIYRRYGLDYTYFTIEPYGVRLVARTYDKVTDEWKDLSQFVGKLRPFNRQPFSYRIRQIFRDRFQMDIPENAYFLALYDVPKPSGWQIGALVFASVLWLVMFYMFFFFDWKRFSPKRSLQQDQEHPASNSP